MGLDNTSSMCSRTLSYDINSTLVHEDLATEPGCPVDAHALNDDRNATQSPLSPLSSLQPPSREMPLNERCPSCAFTTPT